MRNTIKLFFKRIRTRIQAKLAKYPVYVKFLGFKKKLADGILKALLAIFNVIGPVWNFFFIKKSDGSPERSPKIQIETKSQGFILPCGRKEQKDFHFLKSCVSFLPYATIYFEQGLRLII